MSTSRPFLASSRRLRLDDEALARHARWIDGEVWTERPLPTDRPGLILTVHGIELMSPGRGRQRWHPGMAHRRRDLGFGDALPKALRLRPGEQVLDATLGFGHDALVLGALGARVEALETVPLLLCFTMAGLHAYDAAVARRIHARRANHVEALRAAAPGTWDHVYLDPMFPRAAAGDSPTWADLRPLARYGPRPDAELLALAWRAARRSVALKLAAHEPPPAWPEGPTAQVRGSKRVHFAVWSRG